MHFQQPLLTTTDSVSTNTVPPTGCSGRHASRLGPNTVRNRSTLVEERAIVCDPAQLSRVNGNRKLHTSGN